MLCLQTNMFVCVLRWESILFRTDGKYKGIGWVWHCCHFDQSQIICISFVFFSTIVYTFVLCTVRCRLCLSFSISQDHRCWGIVCRDCKFIIIRLVSDYESTM
jgi:hypothetical protein